MAKTYFNYAALSTGYTFANGDTAGAAAVGATNTAVSNGTLSIVTTNVPDGFVKWLQGTGQGTSGTSYLTTTLPNTRTFSGSVFWRMDALGTIGANLNYVAAGATRTVALSILSTEQIRFFDSANATMFTSTVSGGFTPGVIYRTDYYLTVGTTTSNGSFATETYTETGTTPISGASFSSNAVNMGTADITNLRHGTRSGTGTADENIRMGMGYDTAAAYLMGVRNNDTADAGADQVVEPWVTVTLTATSSSSSVTWSQVSGPAVTLAGSGALTRTFIAPPSFSGSTLVFRATNGAASDDVSITALPATEGLVTSNSPLTVIPIRMTRVT